VRLITSSSYEPSYRYLLPHEQSVITVRQHPARVLPALTVALGGLLAALAVSGMLRSSSTAAIVVWSLTIFLMARVFFEVFSWIVQYITVTNERILLISGVISRKITTVSLANVKDLDFERSTGGNLFGYGTFTITAEGKPKIVIDYIPYPEQLYLEFVNLLMPSKPDDDDEAD
jgi:membrane protein YdbS with pleckstrin-like domain